MIIDLIAQSLLNINIILRIIIIFTIIGALWLLNKKNENVRLEVDLNFYDTIPFIVTHISYYLCEKLIFQHSHAHDMVLLCKTGFFIIDIIILLVVLIKTTINVGPILAIPTTMIKMMIIIIPAIIYAHIAFISFWSIVFYFIIIGLLGILIF